MDDCGALSHADDVEPLLGVSPPYDPQALQPKIEQLLEEIRSGAHGTPPPIELVGSLALFWSMLLPMAYQWDVVPVKTSRGRQLGFSDKQRNYLILPITYFDALSRLATHAAKPSPAALFHAIGNGGLPKSSPGKFLIIAD
jgi:hypothetical protein